MDPAPENTPAPIPLNYSQSPAHRPTTSDYITLTAALAANFLLGIDSLLMHFERSYPANPINIRDDLYPYRRLCGWASLLIGAYAFIAALTLLIRHHRKIPKLSLAIAIAYWGWILIILMTGNG